MKKLVVGALVASGLVVGLSALDLKNLGKGLEAAQDAGILKTGIPTEKQFKAKIVENSRKFTEDCKKLYHKEMIPYGDSMGDMPISKDDKADIEDQIGEFDRKTQKALNPFTYKAVEKAYKDDPRTLHKYCQVILNNGLSSKESQEFEKETYTKYNLINGTDLPKNKKK